MTLDVATFSQIMTLLTQLSTNYTNIFTDYYNIFINPVPMDITLQFFDQDGNLQTIVIPNRAKDREYILNGNGDPNGNVTGNKGSLYQDLENGNVYINLDSAIDGWSKIVDESELATYIKQGAGSPEGVVIGTKGLLYIDNEHSGLYMKTTASGTNGWVLISETTDLFATVDLNNLSEEGEGHFANPSLDNINATGQAKFNAKQDIDKRIQTISSLSQDDEYPSAGAVYRFAANSANRDLSNLSTTGEGHFANPSLSNLNATGQAVLDAKENITNKVTSISSANTNTQYPSALAVYTGLNGKANTSFDNVSSTGKSRVQSWGTPDYSAGIAVTVWKTDYTPSRNGFLLVYGPTGSISAGANNVAYLTIKTSSGTTIGSYAFAGNNTATTDSLMVPASPNFKYSVTGSSRGTVLGQFFPLAS